MSITVNATEFIKIVEAAADFDDYHCGKFFVSRRPVHRISREPATATVEPLAARLPNFQLPQMALDVTPADDLFSGVADSPLQLRDPSVLPPWALELREMFNGLSEPNPTVARETSPLLRLCECGSHYGLKRLQTQISSEMLQNHISARAKARLNTDLRRTLARVTRPCFALQQEASRLAYRAIRFHARETDQERAEATRRKATACNQLYFIFKMFPVLARLWSQLISQCCNHVAELLLRLSADQRALSDAFFRGWRIGKIIDLGVGLSDPHNRGRTVVLLRFEAGSIIYKPRGGDGEWEWLNLLHWMNSNSFRPKLRAARLLRRQDYCWMEHIQPGSCKNQDAARRFYRRVGGMLCAAYLLKAVDCHRDNIIAAGEHPVLIDAETICHETNTKSLLDPLYETGFLPSSGRRSSYQYRSSALGRTAPGGHTPDIATKPLNAVRYETEIIYGFRSAWRCLLGTTNRRAAFVRRLQRLRRRKGRWIYWPTRNYDVIRRGSIQPAALRSGIERDLLIAGSCKRSTVSRAIAQEEINALKRLDIPYFTQKRNAGTPLPENDIAPSEIVEALRRALYL